MKKITILFIACLFASCSKDNNDLVIEMDKDAKAIYEKERIAWNLQKIENYQFSYRSTYVSIFPPYDEIFVKIAIEKDKEPLLLKKSLDFLTLQDISCDINAVYEYIKYIFMYVDIVQAIKKGKDIPFVDDYPYSFDVEVARNTKSITLAVKYNAQYHYPEEIVFEEFFHAPKPKGYIPFKLQITEFFSTIN